MKKKVSIKDVAIMAQVNPSTVSRFFNTPERLSSDTRIRIEKATSKLGYKLSPHRPGPKTPERAGIYTGKILFLVLGTHMDLRHVTAIPILMNCIQRVILERGLILEVVYADSLADLSGRVSSDYCDGVLVFHRGKCSEVFEKQICELLKNIPAVWCFRSHFDLQNEKDHVFYDNSSIGKIAANYLYKRGHSHVAICNIMEGRHEAFTERTETFISEAERLGMKVTPIAMLAQDKLTPAENNLLMADLFLSKYTPDISGAFFCADDLILSLECALASKGHSLHKLDLIGCNNDWTVMRYLCNNPATIDIKMEEIGVEAVKQLLLRINGDDAPVKEILLKPKLISAPPRN